MEKGLFASFAIVVLLSLSLLYGLRRRGCYPYGYIIVMAFAVRLLVMFLDMFHMCPTLIIHSGTDTETFHNVAVYNQQHNDELIHTNYTVFLTFLYNITGCSRMVAQYVNVVLGTWVIIYLAGCFDLIKLSHRRRKWLLWLVALQPNCVMLASVLLREAIVEFSVAASVFLFLRWALSGRRTDAVCSIAMVSIGSLMHMGVIFVGIGYVLAYAIYSPHRKRVKFSLGSYFLCFLFAMATAYVMVNVVMENDKRFGMLKEKSTEEVLARQMSLTSVAAGGSNYLDWLEYASPTMQLVCTPLKMIYFLFSPLPTDWRGFQDVICFVLDSLIYLWLIYFTLWKARKYRMLGSVRKFLFLSFFTTAFIFGIGTWNAGTAMRHRAKILPLLIVATALVIKAKDGRDKMNKLSYYFSYE